MQPKPNLDLMRAFAVLLVVLDHVLLAEGVPLRILGHTLEPIWIGVFGVYLFFVHTCLVLMWSLERRPNTLDFYIRRAFRIYPLPTVASLLVLVFALPLSSTQQTMFAPFYFTWRGAIANLLLIQNIVRGGGTILGVYWSLPLEVDMYVLLPALFFYVRHSRKLWPLLVLWMLACGLALHDVAGTPELDTVVPCFLPGVMAYVLYAKTTPRLPAWLFPCCLAILLAVFLSMPSVVFAWVVCLALGLGLPYFRQMTFAPLKRASHEVAKYSYSIYLGHVFGLGTSYCLLPLHSAAARISVGLALTVVYSFAGYHLIEAPMIRLGARFADRVAHDRLPPAMV